MVRFYINCNYFDDSVASYHVSGKQNHQFNDTSPSPRLKAGACKEK